MLPFFSETSFQLLTLQRNVLQIGEMLHFLTCNFTYLVLQKGGNAARFSRKVVQHSILQLLLGNKGIDILTVSRKHYQHLTLPIVCCKQGQCCPFLSFFLFSFYLANFVLQTGGSSARLHQKKMLTFALNKSPKRSVPWIGAGRGWGRGGHHNIIVHECGFRGQAPCLGFFLLCCKTGGNAARFSLKKY